MGGNNKISVYSWGLGGRGGWGECARGLDDAEGGDEDVEDGDEKDGDDGPVVGPVGLAHLVVVLDVVAAVPDEPDANDHLEEEAQADHGQRGVVERVLAAALQHVPELVRVRRDQSKVHHALGDRLLLLIDVHVRWRRRVAAREEAREAAGPLPGRRWGLSSHIFILSITMKIVRDAVTGQVYKEGRPRDAEGPNGTWATKTIKVYIHFLYQKLYL